MKLLENSNSLPTAQKALTLYLEFKTKNYSIKSLSEVKALTAKETCDLIRHGMQLNNIMSPIKPISIRELYEAYSDYIANYPNASIFADHYGLSIKEASEFITAGKSLVLYLRTH